MTRGYCVLDAAVGQCTRNRSRADRLADVMKHDVMPFLKTCVDQPGIGRHFFGDVRILFDEENIWLINDGTAENIDMRRPRLRACGGRSGKNGSGSSVGHFAERSRP